MKYLPAFVVTLATSLLSLGVSAAIVRKRDAKTAGSCVIPYVIWDPSRKIPPLSRVGRLTDSIPPDGKFGPKGPE